MAGKDFRGKSLIILQLLKRMHIFDNNAKLTINAGSSVTINKPFLISKGAQFEINI